MSIENQGLIRLIREKAAADQAVAEAATMTQKAPSIPSWQESQYEVPSMPLGGPDKPQVGLGYDRDLQFLRLHSPYSKLLDTFPNENDPVWEKTLRYIRNEHDNRGLFPSLLKQLDTVSSMKLRDSIPSQKPLEALLRLIAGGPNAAIQSFDSIIQAKYGPTDPIAGNISKIRTALSTDVSSNTRAIIDGFLRDPDNFKKVLVAGAYGNSKIPDVYSNIISNADWGTVGRNRLDPSLNAPQAIAAFLKELNSGIVNKLEAKELASLYNRRYSPQGGLNKLAFDTEFRQGRTASQAIILRSAVIEKYLSSLQ